MARKLQLTNYMYSLSFIALVSLTSAGEQKHVIIWTDISDVAFLNDTIKCACVKLQNMVCANSIYRYPVAGFGIKEVANAYRDHQGKSINA